jgi:hypothetical protein
MVCKIADFGLSRKVKDMHENAKGSDGTVRVFRQSFALKYAIGSHACSLEASTCVTNGLPFGCSLLPVYTVNCVEVLKAAITTEAMLTMSPVTTLMTSRNTEGSDYYRSEGGIFPVRSTARCAFSDRILYSRMSLVPTPCSLEASRCVTNDIPLGGPLFYRFTL